MQRTQNIFEKKNSEGKKMLYYSRKNFNNLHHNLIAFSVMFMKLTFSLHFIQNCNFNNFIKSLLHLKLRIFHTAYTARQSRI